MAIQMKQSVVETKCSNIENNFDEAKDKIENRFTEIESRNIKMRLCI